MIFDEEEGVGILHRTFDQAKLLAKRFAYQAVITPPSPLIGLLVSGPKVVDLAATAISIAVPEAAPIASKVAMGYKLLPLDKIYEKHDAAVEYTARKLNLPKEYWVDMNEYRQKRDGFLDFFSRSKPTAAPQPA